MKNKNTSVLPLFSQLSSITLPLEMALGPIHRSQLINYLGEERWATYPSCPSALWKLRLMATFTARVSSPANQTPHICSPSMKLFKIMELSRHSFYCSLIFHCKYEHREWKAPRPCTSKHFNDSLAVWLQTSYLACLSLIFLMCNTGPNNTNNPDIRWWWVLVTRALGQSLAHSRYSITWHQVNTT